MKRSMIEIQPKPNKYDTISAIAVTFMIAVMVFWWGYGCVI